MPLSRDNFYKRKGSTLADYNMFSFIHSESSGLIIDKNELAFR